MTYAKVFPGWTGTGSGLRWLVTGLLCAGFFLLAPPLGAQEAEDEAPPAKITPQERAALLGAVTGTKAGLKELNKLLTEGDAGPDQIKARAKGLLQQLKDAGFIEDATAMMTAADRIIQAAVTNVGGGARIVEFDPSAANFVPPKGVIALDFGPADGNLAEGFEKVTNNDPRIGGTAQSALQSIRRPGQEGLQSDGLIGVKTLKVPMTKSGRWRIILMTEAIGEGSSVSAPFGSTIIVNGVKITISEALPQDWVRVARLKQGERSVAQIVDPSKKASARFVGGIIILEVDIPGNVLEIDFDAEDETDGRTYLTGAIFEPTDQESILDLPPEAKEAVFSNERRLLAEADIGSTVAEVVAELVPEAGEEDIVELLDLPEPILEDEQLASPS
ncbi:MAG: hypothetical protein J4G10_00290 [Alphaproteobacteria bacterium]|nr:hypothetical protein [Alphaproteobacteria bacterium]